MLILSRNKNQKLMIGDDITIEVMGVKGSQVRLGIEAPRVIPVHREEVYARIQGENSEINTNFESKISRLLQKFNGAANDESLITTSKG